MSTNLEDIKDKKLWAALVAEFLGVFFLVIMACGACLVEFDIVRISLAFGFSIATLVWATAHLSGGHLNPAVTLAFFVTRKISLVRFVFYVFVQCVGAIAGAGVLRLIHSSRDEYGTLGTSAPGPNISGGEACGIELLITFVLVWAVFATVDEQRLMGGSGPLAIGLAIAMCHLYAVPFTGAGMNPARVLGPALVSNTWKSHWAYWVGPAIGAIAAAFIYDFIFAVNATPYKLAGFFKHDYKDENYGIHGKKTDLSKNHTEMD